MAEPPQPTTVPASGPEPALPPDRAAPRSREPRLAAPSWRATQLYLAFIVFVLLALLALPTVIQRHTATIRVAVLNVVARARDLMDDIQRDMAVESQAGAMYEETGQPVYLERFRQARAGDAVALAQLRPLADRLGPEVRAQADTLQSALARWEPALPAPPGRSPGATRLDAQGGLFLDAVQASRALDLAIGRATEQGRTDARAAQALEGRLTLLLAGLALVAVLLLSRLAHQLRVAARTEMELRRKLEASAAARERLIRGFSHDLKNPLGAADGFAQLLEQGILDDPGRRSEGIRRLRAAISSALGLVEDLLDLAQADAGLLRLRQVPVDVGAVAREVAAECSAQARAAGVSLDLDLPPRLDAARSDPARIRQILGNLVTNAIKYGGSGGAVAIAARSGTGETRAPSAGAWIVLEVSDRGPGIPLEKQDWIFGEFTRLEPTGPAGTGLGLAISQRLAHALGGALRLDSRPGQGSTFSLWLPADGHP